jgi:hypothetical protein
MYWHYTDKWVFALYRYMCLHTRQSRTWMARCCADGTLIARAQVPQGHGQRQAPGRCREARQGRAPALRGQVRPSRAADHGMAWHVMNHTLPACLPARISTTPVRQNKAQAPAPILRPLVSSCRSGGSVKGVRWKINVDGSAIPGLERGHPSDDALSAFIVYSLVAAAGHQERGRRHAAGRRTVRQAGHEGLHRPARVGPARVEEPGVWMGLIYMDEMTLG